MSFELVGFAVTDGDDFKKAAKRLKKKYRHIDEDINLFLKNIKTTDDLGINIKDNIYKVRIKNSDKTTGKSGGYRLLTYVKLINKELFLLYIYDKSELENINEKDLDELVVRLDGLQ
ncbi:MAG TPA: type II toxin-antitoxin system RelE/ParE family toxin [Campylobacterales bacterium]|nr:type II toxin-antitoxin system RelE/ParE family toxin [Campylobacterales bacterium]